MEIKIKDLTYSYCTSQKKINVFENLNLEIPAEKITGIVGKCGSGKTTLLRLMEGLIYPDEGIIKMGRYTINKPSKSENIADLRYRIGLVFQFPEDQFFEPTVKEELELGLKLHNYRLSEMEERVKDALKMVGLSERYLNEDPLKLSSGDKRLVAIASILIYNPKVILLDEPTVGLDSSSKKELIKLIRMLKQKYNKTIIIASHDIDMLHKIVDKVIVLDNKKVLINGTKYEVFSNQPLLNSHGLKIPKVMDFSNRVLNRTGVKIGYRDEINDLIKDIYRYVK